MVNTFFSAYFLALLAAAPPEAESAPVKFEFRDAAIHDGRSVLTFCPMSLGATPVRPITLAAPVSAAARYGLALVGPSADTALAVVWDPQAPGGPQLWVDADGDGRLTRDECHTLTQKETAIPIRVQLSPDKGAPTERRTLLVRRAAVGDGLSYAVRGYAVGTLNLGGKSYQAMLTDGNADGCFHTAGRDRIWIDLDGDGHFDGLTEQFVLGSPITVAGQVYIIKSNTTASEVRVTRRVTARGRARLTLTGPKDPPVHDFAAHLVSDIGELVTIRDLGKPVAVAAGKYRVDELRFEMSGVRGQTWTYKFGGSGPYLLDVRPGQEATLALLAGLDLKVDVPIPSGDAIPGRKLAVSPSVVTHAALYLADCTVREAGASGGQACTADIRLTSARGMAVDRAASGFN
jgi:hypothetical protein